MGVPSVRSGIQIVGDLQWGAHFCQFYESSQDLADIVIPYLLAGIHGNEQCIWVTSKPLHADVARGLLGAVVPDIRALEHSGQIALIDYRDWYTKIGPLTIDGLLRMWIDLQDLALQRGHAGLRVTGNASWLYRYTWKSFLEYEAGVTAMLRGLRILAFCTYSLGQCSSHRIIDVVQSHQFALVRRAKRWELIESSPLKIAKEELNKLNEELEERIRQRTAELEVALRVREDFISVASHELKTPIASLQLYIESLVRANAKGAFSQAQLAERLAKAKAECGRLEALMDYLLDFSRASSGQLPLSYEEVDLAELARMTAQHFDDSLRQASCALSLRADAPIIGVWDRRRIEQVLVNLLSNAIRHAPGAPIELTVTEQDGQAVLSVRDHGPGIEPDKLDRIFERFVQLSPPEQHRGGFGLGLWIVRKIVDAFRGTLDVKSVPGEGSTFIVMLPHAPPAWC
jgi:signal transduction histidine kinase